MKKIVLLSMMFLGGIAGRAQIRFETLSLAEARALAAEREALLFVNVGASWCGPCRTMLRDVFSREEVGAYMNEHFVAVRYDGEKDTDGRVLVARYGIRSIPACLVFNRSGRLVGETAGAMEAEAFLRKMRKIVERQRARTR